MSSTIEYKGYTGTVEYSSEDRCLHGVLVGIRDTVSYAAVDVKTLERNFKAAVDEYLEFCKAKGKSQTSPSRASFRCV